MHEYMTRHMVALQPLTYADMSYETGQTFLATPIDAPYLERARRARLAAAAEVPTPIVEVPTAPIAAISEPVIEDDEDAGPELEDRLDNALGAADAEQPAATPRRRGRPRRVQV